MQRASKPWWQQATALVSLSAGGAITGFSFVPKAAVDFSSPTSLPVNLLALQHSVRQAPASDATLRTAIVNVAQHYLQLAQDKTPAEMEAMIWQQDSIDQADHGQSCAAFASLTLELAAKVVGQQSWVTGGSSYPWPLHSWADVRVEANPASPGIISIQQDAEAHGRWHPLDAGYQPQPGDWVLFHGHVEVVTEYVHGVLHTIGGDSLPNFSVNAHEYPAPLAGAGVVGFVNNGSLSAAHPAGPSGSAPAAHGRSHRAASQASTADATGQAAIPGTAPATTADAGARQHHPAAANQHADRAPASQAAARPSAGLADIPGSRRASGPAKAEHRAHRAPARQAEVDVVTGQADIPGAARPAPAGHQHRHGAKNGRAGRPSLADAPGDAAIPGLAASGQHDTAGPASSAGSTGQHQLARSTPVDAAATHQAFINAVAPGAIASQRAYGVPAAVTIAQAIEESDWGNSLLASKDHNLFGMKGTGPAGSDSLPTQEFENGQWITTTAPFRVYHNFAESIDDHGRLLADSGYYQQAMAMRRAPNAFASALTGVYATDPQYGAKLINLMQHYDLYQYDTGGAAGRAAPARQQPRPAPSHRASPAPARSTTPPSASPAPTPPSARPAPTPSSTPAHTPAATPLPTATGSPTATPPARHPGQPSTTRRASHSSTATQDPAARSASLSGQATIPGIPDAGADTPAATGTPRPTALAVTRADELTPPHRPARHSTPPRTTQSAVLTAQHTPARSAPAARPASTRQAWTTLRRYRPEIPPSVHTAFLASAKVPLRR